MLENRSHDFYLIRRTLDDALVDNQIRPLFNKWIQTGELKEYLPSIDACRGLEGGSYHQETVYEHLLKSLDAASGYWIRLKWAVLLHDVGKFPTQNKTYNSDGSISISFHSHEVSGSVLACRDLSNLGYPKDICEDVSHLVRHHMFRFAEDLSDRTVKRWLYKVGKKYWNDLFLLRLADRRGNLANVNKPIITRELADLLQKINMFIDRGDIIFKEDLDISELSIKRLNRKGVGLHDIYPNLIGLVSEDKSRNNNQWLIEYVSRIYG
jgi:predicted HD phosphohydrolase